jgi:hypothetical protein
MVLCGLLKAKKSMLWLRSPQLVVGNVINLGIRLAQSVQQVKGRGVRMFRSGQALHVCYTCMAK